MSQLPALSRCVTRGTEHWAPSKVPRPGTFRVVISKTNATRGSGLVPCWVFIPEGLCRACSH